MSKTTCAAALCSRGAVKQVYVCAEYAKEKKSMDAVALDRHGMFYVRVHLCPRHLAAFWPQKASSGGLSE